MDEDFLDLIDQAFLEGQIDGETVDLMWFWLAGGPYYNPLDLQKALLVNR